LSRPPVQLVVTDLDGTLWDRDCVIHPAAVAAVGQVLARGTPILAATARRQRSVLPRLAPYGLSLPLVLLDGALGRDPDDGGTFHRRVFDQDSAPSVLEAFASTWTTGETLSSGPIRRRPRPTWPTWPASVLGAT
jgi:hydroxymethylpyrimidine pyrophosphatase-like HAD family hydrolase